jgi:hypothetical protein
MTVEQMRRVLKARPFVPFHIHLADSRAVFVSHPEIVAFSGSGRTIHVFEDSMYEEIIDLLLVVSLKPANAEGSRRSNVN